MECGVHHARLDALGHIRLQQRLPRAAVHAHPVAIGNAALFRILGVNVQPILLMPNAVGGTASLCADVVLRQNPPGGEQQRELRRDFFVGRYILRDQEPPQAAREGLRVHDVHTGDGRAVVARPLQTAVFIEFGVAHARKSRRQARNFVHDFARVRVIHRVAKSLREFLRRFPVGVLAQRRHDLAHAVDAPLGIGKRAVFFQKAAAR